MLAAQELEEAMAALLGAQEELGLWDRASEDWDADRERIWNQIFKDPAGVLKKKLALPGDLGDELTKAVAARNLLAHHYLRDRFNPAGPQTGDIDKLREAADRFRALARTIDDEQSPPRCSFHRARQAEGSPGPSGSDPRPESLLRFFVRPGKPRTAGHALTG